LEYFRSEGRLGELEDWDDDILWAAIEAHEEDDDEEEDRTADQWADKVVECAEDQSDSAARTIARELSVCIRRAGSAKGKFGSVGQALLYYVKEGMILADVHDGNVGQVTRNGKPTVAITDPGHMVPLKPKYMNVEVPMLGGGGRAAGRPRSAQTMVEDILDEISTSGWGRGRRPSEPEFGLPRILANPRRRRP
jgi:hypothetical protein